MAYSGNVSQLFLLKPASNAQPSPEDFGMEVGTATLSSGAVEVPTKLTSVDRALLSYSGAVTSGGETEALTTDKVISSGAVTVTGKGNLVFDYIFFGRIASQI